MKDDLEQAILAHTGAMQSCAEAEDWERVLMLSKERHELLIRHYESGRDPELARMLVAADAQIRELVDAGMSRTREEMARQSDGRRAFDSYSSTYAAGLAADQARDALFHATSDC